MKSGFVDLQVNGYGGVSFTDPGLTLDAVAGVCEALSRGGTLAFCPTVITTSPGVYHRALPVIARAMRMPGLAGRMPGIHLEGPFISPEDGAVGAHPKAFVQPPSIEEFDALYALAEGRIAILTLAPEMPGAIPLVRHAVSMGVVVGIGHTLASADDVRAAVDAGVTLSTHLGNGCPNLIHRHHNPIWPQLAEDRLSAMLIADGHHLPLEVLRVFLSVKGPRRVIVTSDAAPAAGLPPGDYAFFGTRARLEPSGRLRNLEADTLAGSSATLLECMNVTAGIGILAEEDLWRVGRDNPLAVLGLGTADLPGPGSVAFVGGRFALESDGPAGV